jgi:hypothetical protein
VRDDGGDPRRGCSTRGIKHEQQLDQVLLHRRDQWLDQEDVALAAVSAQLHLQAVVAEPPDLCWLQRHAEVRADLCR